MGHLSLAHEGADDLRLRGQAGPGPAQDLVKVGGGAAEAGSAEEKDLLPGDLAQEIGQVGVAVPLVGPETHIEHIGGQCLGGGGAAVEAVLHRQSGLDGQGQLLGISGLAAVDDGVGHFSSSFHRCSGRLDGP